MKPTTDREWLAKQAALEDNCFVSVGGLVTAVEELGRSRGARLTRHAFARLVELTRREHKLTWEQFSNKLDVDLVELIGIADEHYMPTPRSVAKIAQFMHVPAEKLMVLSGIALARNVQFEEEALRFAARSQPVEELSHEEQEALEEYVKFLCEQ
jgi:hypothetical protein